MKNLKFSLVALAVGLIAVIGLSVHFWGGSGNSAAVSTEQNVAGIGGGSVFTNIDQYVNGLAVGDVISYTKALTLGSRVNQASWKNNTGKTAYVDFAEIVTDGTASTSFKFYVATSTAATVSDGAGPFSSVINGWTLATSSAATTTSSVDAGQHVGSNVIPVSAGQYVVLDLQSAGNSCTYQGNLGVGANCESATSTNRGFNVKALIKMHFYR